MSASSSRPETEVAPTTPGGPLRRPVHVLIATILRGGGPTGVETHVDQVRRHLESYGAEVDLVTSFSWLRWLAMVVYAPRRPLERISPAAGVWWYRAMHQLFLRQALRHRWRRHPEAVVYAQCPVSARAALSARRSAAQRVVLVIHFDVSQADEWAYRGLIPRGGRLFRSIRRLEHEVLVEVDGIVYVADSARRGVLSHVPEADQVPWTVIPNFVDEGPRQRPAQLPAPADLVTVGSLERFKNHEYLLEVLARAAARGRRFTLEIIGQGSQLRHLQKRARALGLGADVRFLGRRDDTRAQLPGHKLYVHASNREVFPLALIEAMAAGLPVATSAVGGIPELLGHGETGSFLPLDDAEAAASLLIDLLDDPAALQHAGRAARSRFLRCYHSARVGPQLATFIVDGHQPHRAAISAPAAGRDGGAGGPPGGPPLPPATPRGAPRRERSPAMAGGRRAFTTVTDQGFSSVSNFAVGVAVARLAGAAGLGSFTFAYAGWLMVAALHRALITDPMMIEGDARSPEARLGIGRGLAAELWLGLFGAVGFVALGLVLLFAGQHPFGVAMVALAPWLPVLVVQDYWRWAGFMSSRPGRALANDTVFNIAQGAFFALIFLTRFHSVVAVICAWGLGGAAGAFYGLRQFRVLPTLRGGLSLLGQRWSFSKWIAGTSVAGWSSAQAYVLVAGTILGPAALGALKAAQTLVTGPALVLIQAGGSIGMPEATKAHAERGWKGLLSVARIVTAAGVASVGVCVVVVVFAGRFLLAKVYGPAFANDETAAVLIGISNCIAALVLGPVLILKATRNTKHLFTAIMLTLVASLVSVVVFSLLYGVDGAAGATIVTAVVQAGAYRWLQHKVHPSRAQGREARSPAGPPPEAAAAPVAVG